MPNSGNPKIAMLREFLDRVGRFDIDGAGEFLHDAAVMAFPYLDQLPDVVGRQAIVEQIRSTVPLQLKEMNFTYDAWYETADPDTIIAEYRSTCPLRSGAGCYENQYIGVFGFRDGKIVLYKEYLNPAKMAVFGEQLG